MAAIVIMAFPVGGSVGYASVVGGDIKESISTIFFFLVKSFRVNYYTSKSTTHYATDSRMKIKLKKTNSCSKRKLDMLLIVMVEHRVPPDPTVLSSKLGQHPDEAWGWELHAYPWSSPRRGSQSRVDVCPSARGRGERGSRREGESSRAMAMNSRQQAAAVELVIRPMCPSTALICFFVQFAISGRRASIAAGSHCPAQRRAIRSGWLGMMSRARNLRPNSSVGPGGSRFIVIVRSKEPPERAFVVPGEVQRTWA